MYAYVALTVILALILYLVFNYKNTPKLTISNVSELICLFENNKTLPIGTKTRWDLVGVVNGLRMWSRKLCFAVSVNPLVVVGSYTQVGISLEILCSVLTNSKTQKHWNSYLPKNSVIKTFPLNPTIFEREAMYVEMKEVKIGKVLYEGCTRFANKFLSKQNRINNIRNDIIRCWQGREDGGLWLVEHSVTFSQWLFYLVSPVPDDPEASMVTVITTKCLIPSIKDLIIPSSISNVDPTILISGLKDFIVTKKLKISSPLSLSQSSQSSKPTLIDQAESNAIQLIKTDDTGQGKEDISIFQKFKNLLDEKKEEQGRIRKAGSSDLPTTTTTTDLSPMDIIRRFSISGKLFDDKKTDAVTKETLSPQSSSSRWKALSKVVAKETNAIKSLHKTSNNGAVETSRLVKYLDSIIDNTAEEIINEKSKVSKLDIKASKEEQASESGGWTYCGLEKDTVILKKIRNDTQPFHSYMSKGLLPCPPKLVYEVLRKPENRMSYDDVIKKVEVLDECGSDVKIVRLLYEVGQNFRREKRSVVMVQGERMEGLKHVITMLSIDWPAVKTQYHGNDDDDGEKENNNNNDDNDEDDDGDNDRNGDRKFDSKDSGKYNLYFDSDEQDKKSSKKMEVNFYNNGRSNVSSVMDEECILDKMGSSGWIIEPFMKGDNLWAMVTYVCQLSFKESSNHNKSLSQMAVEIALKQPLCVKHLRNYINTMALIQSRTELKGDGKKNVTLSLSNALAKFRNVETVKEEEEEEDNDYTEIGVS